MSNAKSKGKSRNQASSAKGTTKKKRSRGRKRQDPKKFWGDVDRLPEPPYELEATTATDAVVQSLGRPPIPGHESSATHYFKLVYDRSVGLAFALAAAGGLDQPAPEPVSAKAADRDDEADEVEDAARTGAGAQNSES